MDFKRNILASYAGQIYVTAIGIVMVPLYLRYMGSEAYGLVGFFAMLQAWFLLLDMGLTPTMARETARYSGGATTANDLRQLLRALEGVFIAVAVLGGGFLIAGAESIASSWLSFQQLSQAEVRDALMLMAVIVALRWVCGLYRGAITGFERLVWLNGFNVLVATARFVLVIPYFIYYSTKVGDFFVFQLVVALLELAALVWQTYRILPKVQPGAKVPWAWAPLRRVLKFSSAVAFTGTVWVLVTQTDKLVLSKLLPLTEYAYFTLAVLAASGVMVVSGPISGALLPRLTKLASAGQDAELVRVYRNATQLVAAIALPATVVLAFFAEPVLWAWTGDPDIRDKAAPVLALYAVGNGIMGLAAFPYYLQFAKGTMRLHLIGSGLFLLLLTPTLVWATSRYGVTGAASAWLIVNAAYFLLWVPTVHRALVPGLHADWVLRDIGPAACCTVLGALLINQLPLWSGTRLEVALQLALVGLTLLIIAVASSASLRTVIASRWRAHLMAKEKTCE